MIKKKEKKLQSSDMKAGKFVIPYLLLNANITYSLVLSSSALFSSSKGFKTI